MWQLWSSNSSVNRRTSERKRSLLVLPSEKEENKVNCASECIRPPILTRRSYLQKIISHNRFKLREIMVFMRSLSFSPFGRRPTVRFRSGWQSNYLLNAPAISTAIATVAPTIGLLPSASNGCIRCKCKWISIHSFAHYLPDAEEAHHLHVCGNRRTSERKGNLFALPSEKEENKVNWWRTCVPVYRSAYGRVSLLFYSIGCCEKKEYFSLQ